MKHYLSIFFVLLLFSLFSCNRKASKNIVIVPDMIPEINLDTAQVQIETPDIEEVVIEVTELVYYGKTACYGDCPVFFLKIYSDGKLEYNGIKNVARQGIVERQLSQEKLTILLEQIESNGFFQLAEKYPIHGKRIVDFPNTILKMNNKKTKHTVVNNYDAPTAFFKIENLLQELILAQGF